MRRWKIKPSYHNINHSRTTESHLRTCAALSPPLPGPASGSRPPWPAGPPCCTHTIHVIQAQLQHAHYTSLFNSTSTNLVIIFTIRWCRYLILSLIKMCELLRASECSLKKYVLTKSCWQTLPTKLDTDQQKRSIILTTKSISEITILCRVGL